MVNIPGQDYPYSVVDEDVIVEYEGDVKVTHKKGYDAKGRLVSFATYRYYPDGTCEYGGWVVEADGYWHGGAYDSRTGIGCSFAPERFVEGDLL